MSSLSDIRAGLAANLSSITGCQISAYVLANPTPPCIYIRPANDIGIEYHQAMHNGLENWYMIVFGQVGAVNDIGAQKQLDEWIDSTGSSSVFAALESDKTLGGACSDLVVRECRGYQEYGRADGSTVLGAEWDVEVLCG